MLRVNSSNVLVVPPFECAWLSDEALQLKDGTGCISFEVKGEFMLPLKNFLTTLAQLELVCHAAGENDVTLILKTHAGSKRWQHFARGSAQPAALPAPDQLQLQQGPWQRPPVDEGYTLILGSHRNSCLKIEKNGVLVHRVSLSHTSLSWGPGLMRALTLVSSAASDSSSWHLSSKTALDFAVSHPAVHVPMQQAVPQQVSQPLCWWTTLCRDVLSGGPSLLGLCAGRKCAGLPPQALQLHTILD